MYAHIEINMDNAAFDEFFPGAEVARILRALADQVDNGGVVRAGKDFANEYDRNISLRDLNGNVVGFFRVNDVPSPAPSDDQLLYREQRRDIHRGSPEDRSQARAERKGGRRG